MCSLIHEVFFLSFFLPSTIFAWSFSSATEEPDNFDRSDSGVDSRLPTWVLRWKMKFVEKAN